MPLQYSITEVDIDAGYVQVEITYDNGLTDSLTIDIHQVATSDETTDLELEAAISQIVRKRQEILFPPAPPRPESAVSMVGKTFTLE